MRTTNQFDIENTLTALQEAIELKKKQMQESTGLKAMPMQAPLSEGIKESMEKLNGVAWRGVDFIRRFREDVDERPWCALRNAALLCLAAGFIYGLLKPAPKRKT